MKSKKLFAVMTLVMFMMTLLPMVAFGAAGDLTCTATANAVAPGGIDNIVNATNTAWNFAVATDAADPAIADGGIFEITLPAGFVSTGATVAAGGITGSTGTPSTAVAVTTPTTSKIKIVATTFTTANAAADTYNIAVTGIGANGSTVGANTATVNVYANAAAYTAGTVQATGTATMALVAAGPANRFTSIVDQNRTTQTADGSSVVKFTVYAFDQFNNEVANPTISVLSSRDVDNVVADGTTADNAGAYTFDGAGGVVKFKVSSTAVGTSKIYIAYGTEASLNGAGAYIDDPTDGNAATAQLIDVKSITFTAAGIGTSQGVAISGQPTGFSAATDTGTGVDDTNAWYMPAVKANGIDTYEIAFRVQTDKGVAIADQNVEFTVEDTVVKLNKTTATTNAAGIVKVKASATKAGTYYVKATAGSQSKEQYIKFDSSGVYSLELITADNQKVAKDSDFSFKVQLFDQSGNQIAAKAAADANDINVQNSVKLKTITKPTDANIDDDITASASTAYTATKTDEGYLNIKIAASKINKEGDYTVKAYLDNGNSVDMHFDVKTQGTVTKLTVSYSADSVPMNTKVGKPTVKRLDDAGYAKTMDLAHPNIKFTVSDVRRLEGTMGTDGSFTSTKDKNYAGELVITAIDTEKNLTATDTMTVMLQTNGFTLTPTGTAEVDKATNVEMQFVDVNGEPVSIADLLGNGIDISFQVASKPAGAIVTTGKASSYEPDIKKKGKTNLTIKSDTAGEVKVNVIATINAGGPAPAAVCTSGGTYAQSITLDVGGAKVVAGAKSVTMFIGATGFVQDGAAKLTDLAPFIQDSRTFVAVRPIADAFGCEIGWDEATQTVTLTREDMTLTIVIGSNVITKVADGVTTTSEADVAAFIKDGRTVLPFRAVGEAFGATVEYDAATQAVSFTQ